jgi:hypothetical protein
VYKLLLITSLAKATMKDAIDAGLKACSTLMQNPLQGGTGLVALGFSPRSPCVQGAV